MAILTTVFFFFIGFLILVTSTEADPQIEVHPSEISLGISSNLDINCSFSSTDHPEMAAFVSLILSKANSSGQTFEEMAAITQFSPDAVTVLTTEKVTATGVHSQTGETFLHLTWDYPTATQAGVYQCVAHGMDILGDLVEIVNSSTVIVAQADLNDIFQKLKEMEIHEMNMEKHIEALEVNNSKMSSYITDHDHTIAVMEKNIQNLQNTVAQLRLLLRLDYLGTYQQHDYYVSKETYMQMNHAISVCKSFGGYLVEIDSANEFNALTNFLDYTSGFDWAMVAGTDEASDGTWVFQSNNRPLPYTRWKDSGASTGPSTCLGLGRGISWKMDDWACGYNSPHSGYRFTCEIPRV